MGPDVFGPTITRQDVGTNERVISLVKQKYRYHVGKFVDFV